MTEGKRKTNFEPGMILNLDHLKKDDLSFDVDAEIARFKTKKGSDLKPPKPDRKLPKPELDDFEQNLR